MKTINFLVSLLFALTALSVSPSIAQVTDPIAKDIYYNYLPSVQIVGLRSSQSLVTGSGVKISYKDIGYVLTNYHVVEHILQGNLYVRDPKTKQAYHTEVVGTDSPVDVALLTLPKELEYLPDGKFIRQLPTAGTALWAIGYPHGSKSINRGIINSEELEKYAFLLNDTPINPGSSGGPLLNSEKEIVGLNVAFQTSRMGNVVVPSNLRSIAIPSTLILKLLPLLADPTAKAVDHAFLPLVLEDTREALPNTYKDFRLPYPFPVRGALVRGIADQSYRQTFRPGDVITKIDGMQIESLQHLMDTTFYDYKPGSNVKIEVWRKDRGETEPSPMELEVRLSGFFGQSLLQ